MKFVAVLLVAFVASISGSPTSKDEFVQQPPERIVGGTQATRGEFPWIVSLQIGSHICGGSIVNANYIVTAAHCATYAANRYTVVAGEHNQNTNEGSEQTRSVAQIISHPQYNSNTFQNDIALMRLSTPLTLNTYVQAANIPSSTFNPAANLVAAGWGTTSESGSLSSILMKVTVPFVTQTTCSANYGASSIKPGMLCAGTGGKDSCQGDSGGPLHSGNTLVGIVSWGIGCARPGYPGVYSSVPYFSSWIAQNS